MSDYTNYIVVFSPYDPKTPGGATVNQLRVVDAWASTGSLAMQEQALRDAMARDEQGRYTNCGEGSFYVAECGERIAQYRNHKADAVRRAVEKLIADPDCAPLLDIPALREAVDDCPDHSLAKLYDFLKGA